MTSTGFKFPTATGFSVGGVGSNAWTNPTNAYADDGAYATVVDGVGTLRQSYGDFAFGIPASATILGVIVEMQSKVDVGTVAVTLRVGYDRVGGGNTAVFDTWTTTETVYTHGTSSDPYGMRTGADMADGNFWLTVFPPANNTGRTCSLDYVKVNVYYDLGSGNFLQFF